MNRQHQDRPCPTRLAIIAGNGELPRRVAQAAYQQGTDVVIYPIVGSADVKNFSGFATAPFLLGRLGWLLKDMAKRNMTDLVLIGGIVRPRIRDMRFDWGLVKNLPELFRVMRGGDDHVLRGVVRFLERRGMRVWGAADIATDLTPAPGALGKYTPSPAHEADIAYGFSLLNALSPYDVGQSVVVIDGRAVAIEGVEGTDGLLKRIVELKATGRLRTRERHGVLVKAPKRTQDLRVDMPVIGPQTVQGAYEAGLAGIAVQAGTVMLADRPAITMQADTSKLFVVAIPAS